MQTKILPKLVVLPFILLTIGLLSTLNGPLFGAPSSGFYISSAASSVEVGSVIQADIRLNTASEVDSLNVVVNYPSDKLEVVSASSGIEPFEFARITDTSQAGKITLERYNATGAPAGVTGDNQVASLRFKTKATGGATISFGGETAAARGGPIIATQKHSFNLTITSPPPPAAVPEPPPPPDDVIASPSTQPSAQPSSNQNRPSGQGGSTNNSASNNAGTSSGGNAANNKQPSNYATLDSDGRPSDGNGESSYSMTLVLKGPDGQPLEGIEVTVQNSARATTDSKGEVIFANLYPGQYTLGARYKNTAYESSFTVEGNVNKKLQQKDVVLDIKESNNIIGLIAASAGSIALLIGGCLLIWRVKLTRQGLSQNFQEQTASASAAPQPQSHINPAIVVAPTQPGTVIKPKDPDENSTTQTDGTLK